VVEPESRTPYIDQVVDEVLRGERLVLFPPGVWAFVAGKLLFLVAAAAGSAAAFPSLLSMVGVPPGAAQMIGLLAVLLLLIVPAFLESRGLPTGRPAFVRVTQACLVAATAGALLALSGDLEVNLTAYAVAALGFAAALAVAHTTAYRTFTVFHQRLRARRESFRGGR
jgi:hypothetical protein